MNRRNTPTLRDSATTSRRWHQFYTDQEKAEIIDQLCDHLTTHGLGRMIAFLTSIGATWAAVYSWMAKDPEIRQRVREAQFAGSFVTAEEILRIADDSEGDYELNDKGKLVLTEAVARAKLRMEARWRYLACVAPSVWRQPMAITGTPDDLATAERDLTDVERVHRVQQLLEAAGARPKQRITVVDAAHEENGPVD